MDKQVKGIKGDLKSNKEALKKSEENPQATSKKSDTKNFMIVLGIMGCCILMLGGYFLVASLIRTVDYKGIQFEIDTKSLSGTSLYKTILPITKDGVKTNYEYYLRKNPKLLEKVEFNGSILIKKAMVFNMKKEFDCQGYQVIAVANFLNLYNLLGVDIMKDENATCDSQGRYTYIEVKEGNETKIGQYGPSCYNIYIKDCEILEGTEKFIIETLAQIKSEA